MDKWISELFAHKELLDMGHSQRAEDLNLGLGWVYYSLARVVRPKTMVVIGSWRGFVPMLFGKALMENQEKGEVIFIDPSMADDFWREPNSVQSYFSGFGITNISHYLMTTQQFVESDEYRQLSNVGIVFIDGYHSKEQARFDYDAFKDILSADGVCLFHDSVREKISEIYGKDNAYTHTVVGFMDELKGETDLQVFDLPFGDGVTMVRKAGSILSL